MTLTGETIRDNRTNGVGTAELYDKGYFEKHFNPPYRRNETQWLDFFNHIAEQLIQSLRPRTILDVGCAIGFLVEAFWRRGVRAYGIDVSEYAITQVPEDLKGFCSVRSVIEPLPENFPQSYDLLTCIEVLEHMPPDEGKMAIKNMASKTRCILFSSTPHDLVEPTHVNVRPVIYWLQSFAEVGFYPDLRFDASFVSPQAFLLRKSRPKTNEDILPFFADSINKKFHIKAQQEEIASQVSKRDQEIQSFRSMRQQLQTEINQISAERAQVLQALATKEAEIIERDARIESLELAQSGLFWELLLAYRRLKDRCFTNGTRTRTVYDRGLARLKALKMETGISRLSLTYPVQGLNGVNGSTAQVMPLLANKFCLILSGCPGDTFRYLCDNTAA